MLLIESSLMLLAVVSALLFPQVGSSWFERFESGFVRLARKPWLAVTVVGITALVLRAALLPILPFPEPIIHDEFGYLLAADTFAHGRLTNPTHPMWVHFETFSIIQKPTYQCFAQPAQGCILALGQVVAGHPFWGLWLSVGLMCAAICWMLQGWLSAEWAFLGGLLAILRYGGFSYWANSYWGGALGALGGALVFGALPRIKHAQRVRYALAMGLGLAILANSRPYEGFVISLPVAAALLVWIAGKPRLPLRVSLLRIVLPLCLSLALLALAMGYYCWRVTDNPFQLPYQAERQQYAVVPYMLWQPLRPPPIYHNEVTKRVYTRNDVLGYDFFRSPIGVLAKLLWSWRFYVGPALTLPLLMLAVVLPYGFSWRQIDKRTGFLLLTFGISLVGLALETFYAPHYMSPSTSVLLVLVLLAMRQMRQWQWHGKPSGLFLSRAVPVVCVALFILRAAAGPGDEHFAPAWDQRGPKTFGRAAMVGKLDQFPGGQLVIVRYKSDHNPFEEWVYNDADINASHVVWAREMSPTENAALVAYFGDRRVWLLEADQDPPALMPYSIAGGTAESREGSLRLDANASPPKQ